MSSDERRRVRLMILYGGRSAEHEVSCVSAFHVASAVDSSRYDVRLVGITTGGKWVDATAALPTGPAKGTITANTTTIALPSPDTLHQHDSKVLEPTEAVTTPGDGPLVVLPLLHGPMGEDGTVQGLLEIAGVPYCGASVAGSSVAMDKGLAKDLIRAAGLPQAKYMHLRETEIAGDLAERVARDLGWPVFVKPANMGSSIGITRAADVDALNQAISLATRFDEYVIIEESIAGREIEIGVLGWPDLRTSVPGEIKPSHEFYDFEDKYLDGAAALEVPALLPEEIADEISRLAVSACRALRIDCMARVDFFFEEGGRGLFINEVNTIPGFTPISMYPRMWAASGVPYAELIDELIAQALRRAARREKFDRHRP